MVFWSTNGKRAIMKTKIKISRSSTSSAVATDTPTYDMVMRTCNFDHSLKESRWRWRLLAFLVFSSLFIPGQTVHCKFSYTHHIISPPAGAMNACATCEDTLLFFARAYLCF